MYITKLQQDLNSIYEWAEQCNMQFNDSKFELLRYGKDSALTSCTSYLTNKGTIIDEKDFVKDLWPSGLRCRTRDPTVVSSNPALGHQC